MGYKKIRVYKNTGFNGIDIPGTPAVLENAAYIDYPDFYFLREDIDLPVVRIKDSYDNLKDVDYVRITDNQTNKNYFYFASPKALAKDVTALGLALDALLTMGGADAQEYISGWLTRGHIPKNEDILFANTAPEEFVPSRPLIVDKWQIIKTTNTYPNKTDVVISNVDIIDVAGTEDLTAEVIEGIVQGDIDPKMYIPWLQVPKDPVGENFGTNFRVWDFDENRNHDFTLCGTAAYDPTNPIVIRGLSKLFSFGQLQLGSSYQIPAEWLLSAPKTSSGLITQLIGWHEVIDLTGAPYEYITGIKNKKALALFRSAHLIALASGDEAVFPIAETAGVRDHGGPRANPRIRVWADPSSTGKPYAGFADLHTGGGTGTGIRHAYADAVHGAQWSNSQIVVEGASGNAWASLSTAMTRASQSRAYQQAVLNNDLTTKKSLMGLEEAMRDRIRFEEIGMPEHVAPVWGRLSDFFITAGGGAGPKNKKFQDNYYGMAGPSMSLATDILRSPYDYMMEEAQTRNALNRARGDVAMNEASLEFLKKARLQEYNETTISDLQSRAVVAPTVMFSPEINLGLYGYNKFGYYETCMNPQDVQEADRYFQRFGYNGLHIPLSAAAINSRQYYNYVEAHGINIKGTGYGMRIRERAIAQLNGGVRIWHVLPDSTYYELN